MPLYMDQHWMQAFYLQANLYTLFQPLQLESVLMHLYQKHRS